MSRTLPLGRAVSTPVATMPDAPALTGTVSVFDPAMCCPTGVCGPGVDPALMQVARDLRWLTARGATVERFGLSQEPQAFTANARVAGLLQAFGDQALPAARRGHHDPARPGIDGVFNEFLHHAGGALDHLARRDAVHCSFG